MFGHEEIEKRLNALETNQAVIVRTQRLILHITDHLIRGKHMSQEDATQAFAEITTSLQDLQAVATTAATVMNTAAQQLNSLDQKYRAQIASGHPVDPADILNKISEIKATLFQSAQGAQTALTATADDAAPDAPGDSTSSSSSSAPPPAGVTSVTGDTNIPKIVPPAPVDTAADPAPSDAPAAPTGQ